jgi:glutathione S-transferase
MADRLVFYHNPMSRGRIVHWMLEEVGALYETKVVDLEKREHKSPAYLAVNPMGKVPAIVHGDTVVTETAAICAYLADAFPRAGLAPPAGDHARGTYYRWLFFAAGCLEPALVDRMVARPPVEREGMLSYGNYESALGALEKALAPGPWILGERFSAADVYVGAQIGWGMFTKSLEPRPVFQKYLERCAQRPAYKRANG